MDTRKRACQEKQQREAEEREQRAAEERRKREEQERIQREVEERARREERLVKIKRDQEMAKKKAALDSVMVCTLYTLIQWRSLYSHVSAGGPECSQVLSPHR